MNGKLKCDRCGWEMHEDRFAIVGEEVLCDLCREGIPHPHKSDDKEKGAAVC